MNKKACYYFENISQLRNLNSQDLADFTNLANKHRLSVFFEQENNNFMDVLSQLAANAQHHEALIPLFTHTVLPSKLVTVRNSRTGHLELIDEVPLVSSKAEKFLPQDFDIYINFPFRIENLLSIFVIHADFDTAEKILTTTL